MKFTSDDLMKVMNIQIGDRIKIYDIVYLVDEEGNLNILPEYYNEEKGYYDDCHVTEIINVEYEILPKIKKIGDLKCNAFDDCRRCPVRTICELLFFDSDTTFYEILEKYLKSGKASFDLEIYDLLLSRLDKEVENGIHK